MLTNNKIKLINSLKLKKQRENHGLFVAEGDKVVQEFLDSDLVVECLYTTNSKAFPEAIKVSEKDLARISNLKTANGVLALVRIPESSLQLQEINKKMTIVLDNIKDPGNLGTIIRIADWFSIDTIICSEETVDAFNPKVIQSTMGSLARVKIYYEDLPSILREFSVPIYGAVFDGNSIYEQTKLTEGAIVFGNESAGISSEILNLINHRITIPRLGGAESLNVAVSAGIICSELIGNSLKHN